MKNLLVIASLILTTATLAQVNTGNDQCYIPKCPGNMVSLVDTNRNLFEGEIIARAGNYVSVEWFFVNGKPAAANQRGNYPLNTLSRNNRPEQYRGLRAALLDVNNNIFEGTILAAIGSRATVEWDKMNGLSIPLKNGNYDLRQLEIHCQEF